MLDQGYAESCDALARFDVRDRLDQVRSPVLAVAGADDVATPPEKLGEISAGVRGGRSVVLPDTAHLAPVERPDEVADLILAHLRGEEPSTDLAAAPEPEPPEPQPEPAPPPPPTPTDPTYVAGNDVRARGARRHPRQPGHGGDHRLHPRLPGADHPLRVGFGVDQAPGSTGAAAR